MNYYPNNPGNQPNMRNNQNEGIPSPDGTINTPPETDMNTEAFQGSMQQILSENIGAYVVVEFLIGTQQMTVREGYIYNVGRSFLVLYNHDNQEYIICDIFSVKFVTFPVPPEHQFQGPVENLEFPQQPGSIVTPGGAGEPMNSAAPTTIPYTYPQTVDFHPGR
jgi:hypothetical protein